MSVLRDAANGQSCVCCGANDGTIVLAHYFGPRRHEYGGGMSRKGADLIGAHLCVKCHQRMDQGPDSKVTRWEHSEEFLHYCALTMLRLIENGTLIIKGSVRRFPVRKLLKRVPREGLE